MKTKAMNRMLTRTLLIALTALLAACGGGGGPPEGGMQMPPTPVNVAEVVDRPVTEWDEFNGRFVAVERVDIRSRVAGTVQSVHFREGALVRSARASPVGSCGHRSGVVLAHAPLCSGSDGVRDGASSALVVQCPGEVGPAKSYRDLHFFCDGSGRRREIPHDSAHLALHARADAGKVDRCAAT